MDTLVEIPRPSSYATYEEFLAAHSDEDPKHRLPECFNRESGYFAPEALKFNPNGRSDVGVITSWKNSADVNLDAGLRGTLVSKTGVGYLIRNTLAHPEIRHIIVAGGNISRDRPSGSDMLLDLYKMYMADPTNIIEASRKYVMADQVREFLPIFFQRVQIHNLFGEGFLERSQEPEHWAEVNRFTHTLEVDKTEYEPIYLGYEQSNDVIRGWGDETAPVILDASNDSVLNAYKRMIRYVGRYGVKKISTKPFVDSPVKKSVTELRGLKIKLNPNIDPENLSDIELAGFTNEPITDENRAQIQAERTAYLMQFTVEDKESIADYTYGNVLGPSMGRVLSELAAKGKSKITLLRQQDITADAPDCLNHLSLQIIGNELFVEAYIRSNDMLDAWRENAYGVIYYTRLITSILNENIDSISQIRIGGISTFSESAHFRDTSYDRIGEINLDLVDGPSFEVPTELPDGFAETEQGTVEIKESIGERVNVKFIRNKNRIKIQIGDIEIEPNTQISPKHELILQNTVPSIMNALVYDHGVITSSEEIIEFTTALTHFLLTGKTNGNFDLKIDDTDEVIKEDDNPKKLKAAILMNIFRRYPALINDSAIAYFASKDMQADEFDPELASIYQDLLGDSVKASDIIRLLEHTNMMSKEGILTSPYAQVVVNEASPAIGAKISKKGINDIVKVLKDNLFGKSAILVGNGSKGNEDYITTESETRIRVDRETLDISVHQVQFLISPEGELSATAVVENCDAMSGDFEKAQAWIARAQELVLEKLLALREVNPHNELLDKLKRGKITMLIKDLHLKKTDVDKAQRIIESYNVKAYREDPRGATEVKRKGNTIIISATNSQSGDPEEFIFEIDRGEGLTPEEETNRIMKNIISERGLYNIPGHLVYIGSNVCREVINIYGE